MGLKITNVNKDDFGDYHCVAKNELSMTRGLIKVHGKIFMTVFKKRIKGKKINPGSIRVFDVDSNAWIDLFFLDSFFECGHYCFKLFFNIFS